MTNGTLPHNANLASSGLLTSKSISAQAKPSGRSRKKRDQSLVRRLLNPKSSSLSLTALAETFALSGKRLMIEIRDENPVQIVRVPSRGL
jgi:hypothetical protein